MVPSRLCMFRVHSRSSKTLFNARQDVPREHTERERGFLCGHGWDGIHTGPSRSIPDPLGLTARQGMGRDRTGDLLSADGRTTAKYSDLEPDSTKRTKPLMSS